MTPQEIIAPYLADGCNKNSLLFAADCIITELESHGYKIMQAITTVHRDGEMRVM